jgi:hypothetical protein
MRCGRIGVIWLWEGALWKAQCFFCYFQFAVDLISVPARHFCNIVLIVLRRRAKLSSCADFEV